MIIPELFGALLLFFGVITVASPRGRRLISAFTNTLFSSAENANPDAMLDLERENIRKAEAEFNNSLAEQAGASEELMNTIKDEEKHVKELTATVNVYLRKADTAPPDQATSFKNTAAQFALQLKEANTSLTDHHTQLADQEQQYKLLTAQRDEAITTANARIDKITRNLKDAVLKEKGAALKEMGAQMATRIGSSGDTLSRLEKTVEDRRNKAAGRARVADDSGNVQVAAEITSELKASEATDALADFIKTKGAPAQLPSRDPSTSLTIENAGEKVEAPRQ